MNKTNKRDQKQNFFNVFSICYQLIILLTILSPKLGAQVNPIHQNYGVFDLENQIRDENKSNDISFWQKNDYIRSIDPKLQKRAATISLFQNILAMSGALLVPATIWESTLNNFNLSYTLRGIGQSLSLTAFIVGLPEILKDNILTFWPEILQSQNDNHIIISDEIVLTDKVFSALNLLGQSSGIAGYRLLAKAHDHKSQALGGMILTFGLTLKALNLYYKINKKGVKGAIGVDIMNNSRDEFEAIIFQAIIKSTVLPIGHLLVATSAMIGGNDNLSLTGAVLVAASANIGNIPDVLRAINKVFDHECSDQHQTYNELTLLLPSISQGESQ